MACAIQARSGSEPRNSVLLYRMPSGLPAPRTPAPRPPDLRTPRPSATPSAGQRTSRSRVVTSKNGNFRAGFLSDRIRHLACASPVRTTGNRHGKFGASAPWYRTRSPRGRCGSPRVATGDLLSRPQVRRAIAIRMTSIRRSDRPRCRNPPEGSDRSNRLLCLTFRRR